MGRRKRSGRRAVSKKRKGSIAPATWNPLDINPGLTLSPDLLTVFGATTIWKAVRATNQFPTGNTQIDYLVNSDSSNNIMSGIAPMGATLTSLGFWSSGQGGMGYYGGTGRFFFNGANSAYGTFYSAPALVTVFYRADDGEIYFALNDIDQNGGNPVARINPALTGIPTGQYPIMGIHGAGNVTILSDPSLMQSTPRSGFNQGL